MILHEFICLKKAEKIVYYIKEKILKNILNRLLVYKIMLK